MRRCLSVFSLVLLLGFAVACQKQALEPAVDIEAAIKAVSDAFWAQSKAGPTKDLDLFMSFVAEDAICAGIGNKEATRNWYSNYFSQGRYWNNSSLDKVEVSAAGDLAYVIGTWEYFRDDQGESSTGKGSNVLVWKKQDDGFWRIIAW
ncbi:MAG: nuclear transport factor 2 family protein [Candidatus Aminicenantes bacterium]|nr:nuclear transport factor 2 family protein [Candidatus Aminicenantes bacterium]